MLAEEQHDFANFPLLFPTLANPCEFLGADSSDVQEEVGGCLQDFESSLFVDADNTRCQLGTNTANRPRGEVLLNAFGRCRVSRLQFIGLELLPMLLVHDPASGCLDVFSRRHRRGGAKDRH